MSGLATRRVEARLSHQYRDNLQEDERGLP
jgi:hypothetical protein